MIKFLGFVVKHHPILSALFVCVMGVACFFAFDFAADWIYFHDPAHREQTFEGWMTPRYVGMSWGLPREIIQDVMQLPEKRDGPPPRLSDITERLGLTLAELQDRVATAKEAFEAEKGGRK